MILPSKELLSKVLGYKINDYALKDTNIKINKITVSHLESEPKIIGYEKVINVYHLAHKCKEWAGNKNYTLSSSIEVDCGYCSISFIEVSGVKNKLVTANTEPEAIFLACEWILKEMKINENNNYRWC